MKKVIVLAALYCTFLTTICAQQADTVTVELARTSKIIFTLQDRSDLDQHRRCDHGPERWLDRRVRRRR